MGDSSFGLAGVPDKEVTYDEAAALLRLSRSRINDLVYRGVLHPVKHPHDARKYLSQDEINWYDRVRRQGSVEPNPHEDHPPQAQPSNTFLAALRWYAEIWMAGTETVAQLNGALAEIAANIAATLTRVSNGEVSLPQNERQRLSDLLTALTTPSLPGEAAPKKEGAMSNKK
jgi:hypothetical protein